MDGYYFEVIICLVYGVLWYFWGRSKIEKLQRMPVRGWRVVQESGTRSVGDDREKLLMANKQKNRS